jgi:BirA family biotin operon repressor/biotin-[acetyl-CoA-carboxylase] ligase
VVEKVLMKLKENENCFVSGEKLSEYMGVSRTAVWKYINELKKEGYSIESSSKKGYKLLPSQDILNAFEVRCNLNTEVLGKKVVFLSTVDSTNEYAKKLAFEGAVEGTVVLAENQVCGKGRLGRAWASADKKGIWMSIVLRPEVPPEEVQLITLAASVAVVKALRESTGIEAGIKWPNDIILDNKKVCGILTEMNSEMEAVNFIILGIGINVNQLTEDFPDEIKKTAVSLRAYSQNVGTGTYFYNRSEIIKKLLFELERIYIKIISNDLKEVTEEWKKYSVTLGKEVRVLTKGDTFTGMAEDITKDGRLVVACADGIKREILSGEVSVRGLLNYI